MAGQLTIATLSDGVNSTSSTNCIQGSAKAWVNFNGSSGAIRASYNVSSVTKSTTGQYLLNFTNALADANYAVTATGSNQGNNWCLVNDTAQAPTASVLPINTKNSSNSNVDCIYGLVAVFR